MGHASLPLILALLAVTGRADEWFQVRSPELYGRRVSVAGKTTSTTRLLAGADPVRDGFWLSVPEGTKPQDVTFEPPLDRAPDIRTVRVPPGLSPGWHVVPLGLTAYGLQKLEDVKSFGVTASTTGFKAGGVRARVQTPTVAVACAATPAQRLTLPLRIADFEGGPLQPAGNRFGLFSGREGDVKARRVRDARGTRLVVTAKLPGERSYAGLWIELAPPGALPTDGDGVDLGGLRSVVVRGRGRLAGVLKIHDVGSAQRDAAVVLGTFAGTGREWTREFPVDASLVDLRRLRSLVISFEKSGTLEVDEVLLLGAGQAVPAPHRAAAGAPTATGRSAWVWHTSDLLQQPEARRRLQKVARRWDLDEVYLQVPATTPATLPELAALVAELHGAGLKVHALDGASWLALPQARAELVGIAARVAAFNATQPPASRFDALHLDVEPYLLPAFGSSRRGELLAGLRSSLAEAKAAAGGLPLWLDVPFWFDSADTGTTVETGPAAGCAKPAFLRDVFGIADGIVVMSYRTRADGADGVASVALGELALGRELGKPVRIGVETIALGPERGWHVALEARPRPRTGRPAVALGGDGYVLFTRTLAAGDAEKLAGRELVAAEYSESTPPAKITFHGRSRDDVEAVVKEALELARRAGTPADGVAYHEARTLP